MGPFITIASPLSLDLINERPGTLAYFLLRGNGVREFRVIKFLASSGASWDSPWESESFLTSLPGVAPSLMTLVSGIKDDVKVILKEVQDKKTCKINIRKVMMTGPTG